MSSSVVILCSVPQGSVLGPRLFFYTHTLPILHYVANEYRVTNNYSRVLLKSPDTFSCSSRMRRWMLIFLAYTFRRNQAIERRYNIQPHLICVPALPCKPENTEITSFHLDTVYCFAKKNTQNMSNVSFDHRQTILHSQNNQLYALDTIKIGCRASSHLIWTQSAFTTSDAKLGTTSTMEVFFG